MAAAAVLLHSPGCSSGLPIGTGKFSQFTDLHLLPSYARHNCYERDVPVVGDSRLDIPPSISWAPALSAKVYSFMDVFKSSFVEVVMFLMHRSCFPQNCRYLANQ